MRRWQLIATLGLAGALSGCVSLYSVSLTQIPKERSHMVEAHADKWIILGLNFSNEYVDVVTEDLMNRCEGGQVKGILTKDENTNYFIGLVMKRTVTARGFCIKS